jgi:hypothetical protein
LKYEHVSLLLLFVYLMTLPQPVQLKGRKINEDCIAEVVEGSGRG